MKNRSWCVSLELNFIVGIIFLLVNISVIFAANNDARVAKYELLLDIATENYEKCCQEIDDVKKKISDSINSNDNVIAKQRQLFLATPSYEHEIKHMMKREFEKHYASLSVLLKKIYGSTDILTMQWSGESPALEELNRSFAEKLPVMRDKYLQILKSKHKIHKIGSRVVVKNKYGKVFSGRFVRIVPGQFLTIGRQVIPCLDLNDDILSQFDPAANEAYLQRLLNEQFPLDLISKDLLLCFTQKSFNRDVSDILQVCMNIYLKAGYLPDTEFTQWLNFNDFKDIFKKECEDVLFEDYLNRHGFYYNANHHTFFPKEFRDTINYFNQLQDKEKRLKEEMDNARLQADFFRNEDVCISKIINFLESWLDDEKNERPTYKYVAPGLRNNFGFNALREWEILTSSKVAVASSGVIVVKIPIRVSASTQGGFEVTFTTYIWVASANLDKWYIINQVNP